MKNKVQKTSKSFLFISAMVLTGSAYAQSYSAPASAITGTGINNTVVGAAAGGQAGNMTGAYNTLLGNLAGQAISTGASNCYIGFEAGYNNTTGVSNTVLGYEAGYGGTAGGNGSYNTLLGFGAGTFSYGSSNIFIGYKAGAQTGGASYFNNKLYIDVSNTSTPLIGGDFSLRTVAINGALSATGMPNSALITTTGAAGNYAQIKSDGTNTMIDQFGTATGAGILLSYNTGKDVSICTNSGSGNGTGIGSNGNGGIVNLGYNVTIGSPYPTYAPSNNIALYVRANNGAAGLNIQTPTTGTIFNVANDGSTLINAKTTASPFKIVNTSMATGGTYAQTPFEVAANGQVFIGTQRSSSNPISAILNVSGNLLVGNAGGTAGIYINQTNWADFVFDKNYTLMPLNEVENFYKENHHLPNVPTTKDIQTNGNNIGQTEVVLLQKLEELTLYIVDQNKEMEKMKLEIKKLAGAKTK